MVNSNFIIFCLVILFCGFILYKWITYKPKFFHSRINAKYNYENPPNVSFLKYPLYYLTKPFVFELFPGDCLYIPYGWWHWIFSKGETMALNQWFNSNINIDVNKRRKPYKFKNINYVPELWDTELLKEKLTNDGYGGGSDYPNLCSFIKPNRVYPEENNVYQTYSNFKSFLDYGEDIKPYLGFLLEDFIPEEYKNQLVDPGNIEKCNFWYYSNGANSGLHFDNYENYLCQMKGSKKVYLFPPSSSWCLYADTVLKSSIY